MLAHAFWLFDVQATGGELSIAAVWWALADLLGWLIVGTALWKARSARQSLPLNVPEFPADFPWFVDALVWGYPPVLTFSVLIIARQLDLSPLVTALALVIALGQWPLWLGVSRLRCDITDSAVVVRLLGHATTVRWEELTSIQAVRTVAGEQFHVSRTTGRPVRIAAPVERDRFLQLLRERAPLAHFEV